jgi:iron complex transport system ATP-binding protein
MTPARGPRIGFERVVFGYGPGGEPVLRELSVDIPAGSVTAILGPNGAGKTTLLLLALGWLVPRSGRVLLGGRLLPGRSRRERGRLMALVPQTERMPFNYTVMEYALMGRAPHLAPLGMPGAEDRRICAEAVEEAGLGALRGRAVTELSAGERQLALVARALAQEPALLLMDEPTSHLDLANKVRILDLVRAQSARGVTVLLTTHEPEVAAAATHVVLMREGRVHRAGPLEEVFTTENLSATYGIPVRVTETEGGRVASWRPRPTGTAAAPGAGSPA